MRQATGGDRRSNTMVFTLIIGMASIFLSLQWAYANATWDFSFTSKKAPIASVE
jgi:hypothetical protein